MKSSDIKRILSAPIEVLRVATKADMKTSHTPNDKNGWYYTFRLKSGPSFVAKLTKETEQFSFRPLRNKLPYLILLEWTKKKDVADLGYETCCFLDTKCDDRKRHLYQPIYEKILSPKPIGSEGFPRTKIAFQYYSYPAMLERAICLRNQLKAHEMIEQALVASQQQLDNLLIPRKETNEFVQQKIKERRKQNG